MGMTPINIIGSLLFSQGYDVCIDQTKKATTGYIYFGYSNSGNGTRVSPADPKWAILRLSVTNNNLLNWFRWADFKGLQQNQVWNSNGQDDVYNGTAVFD